MNPLEKEEYREYALETWNQSTSQPLQIAHAAMGIAGELGEYFRTLEKSRLREKHKDEFGDVLYYLSMLRFSCDLGVAKFTDTESIPYKVGQGTVYRQPGQGQLWRNVVSPIVELGKKFGFQNAAEGETGVTPEGVVEEMQEEVFEIDTLTEWLAVWLMNHADQKSYRVDKIRAMNIEKLANK